MTTKMRAINLFLDNPEVPLLLFNIESLNYEKFVNMINFKKIDRNMLLDDRIIDGRLIKANINIVDLLSLKFLTEIFKPQLDDSKYYEDNLQVINELYEYLKNNLVCIREPVEYLKFLFDTAKSDLKYKINKYLDELMKNKANELNLELNEDNWDDIFKLLNINSEKLVDISNSFVKNTILDKENIFLMEMNKDIGNFLNNILPKLYDEFVGLYEQIEKNQVLLESEIDSYFMTQFTNLFTTIKYINKFEPPIYPNNQK
jgi:hypothetical protein